jgi:hypothetical protein
VLVSKAAIDLNAMTKTNDGRPRLFLMGGRRLTAGDVASLYKALTGKDATPADLEQACHQLEQAYASAADELKGSKQ